MVLANLADPKHKLTVVVAGGGNATHVLCGLLGAHAQYVVRVWNVVEAEVAVWKERLHANGRAIVVRDFGMPGTPETTGYVSLVSSDAAEVLVGADMLIIAVPAFAHETYLTAAAAHAPAGMAVGVMVTAGGFDWAVRHAFKHAFASMVTFGMETLPWACRLSEYATTVDILGTKRSLHVAVWPPPAAEGIVGFFSRALGEHVHYVPCHSFTSHTLMNGARGGGSGRAQTAAGGAAVGALNPVPRARARPLPAFAARRNPPSSSAAGNAHFHPAIVHAQFADWREGESAPYAHKPLLYQGVTQEGAGDMIEGLRCVRVRACAAGACARGPGARGPRELTTTTTARAHRPPAPRNLAPISRPPRRRRHRRCCWRGCSKENMAIKAAIHAADPDVDLSTVIPLRDFFQNIYRDDIRDTSCLAKMLNSNSGYKGLTHAMVAVEGGWAPDFGSRYLCEDIPFGLVPIKALALALGVATPLVDRLLLWGQQKLGKEYLVDGELAGRDLGETRCPQRYGLKTLAEILAVDDQLSHVAQA